LDKSGAEHCVVEYRVVSDDELKRVNDLELIRQAHINSLNDSLSLSSNQQSGTYGRSNQVIKISANVKGKEPAKKPSLKMNLSRMNKDVASLKESRQRDKEVKAQETKEMYNKREAIRPHVRLGADRSTKPHVKLAEMFVELIDEVSKWPGALPFLRPVLKSFPGYHEKVKSPIDLQTLKDRCLNQFRYRDRASFLKDLELLASNAVLFNGEDHEIAIEAKKIVQFIKDKIAQDSKFEEMEISCQSVRTGRGVKKGNQRPAKTNSPPPSRNIRTTPNKNTQLTGLSSTTGPKIKIKPITQSASSSSSKPVAPKKPVEDDGDSSSGEEEVLESSQA
jgi:hypothetical protein